MLNKIYLQILEIETMVGVGAHKRERANIEKRLKSTKNSNSKWKFEKDKEVTWSWERMEKTGERSFQGPRMQNKYEMKVFHSQTLKGLSCALCSLYKINTWQNSVFIGEMETLHIVF